jgi:hypothetical protein
MAYADWFLNSSWWWLSLWLPSLAFLLPTGSDRKETRP